MVFPFVVNQHVQVSILQQPAFCVVRSLIAFRLTSTHKDYCVVGTDAGKITILEYLPENSEVFTTLPELVIYRQLVCVALVSAWPYNFSYHTQRGVYSGVYKCGRP